MIDPETLKYKILSTIYNRYNIDLDKGEFQWVCEYSLNFNMTDDEKLEASVSCIDNLILEAIERPGLSVPTITSLEAFVGVPGHDIVIQFHFLQKGNPAFTATTFLPEPALIVNPEKE